MNLIRDIFMFGDYTFKITTTFLGPNELKNIRGHVTH